MVMVISGFDPSAGAGMLQDIKIFSLLGITALGVVSAYTVQNEKKVYFSKFRKWEEMEQEMSVLPQPTHIKIGLISPEFVKLIREKYPNAKIVWNIVLKSSSGYDFEPPELVIENLRYADYVVLNNQEAEILKITPSEKIIITGGHESLPNRIRIHYRDEIFETDRVPGRFHGTGCAFSSLLTGFLHMNYPVDEAIIAAMGLLKNILSQSCTQVQPELLAREWMKWDAVCKLNEIKEDIMSFGNKTVPEVGQNISYALPWSTNEYEVAKFPGRIKLIEGKPAFSSEPSFRDKSHTARMVLTSLKVAPHIRCVTNIRYKKDYIEKALELGLKVYKYDRNSEPEEIADGDESSMQWMINQSVRELNSFPDIIYDEGFWGKEAMIRVFGRNPKDVIQKVKSIVE
ncbi:thiamine-phosphate synthase family protein [Fervidobacterium sp.]